MIIAGIVMMALQVYISWVIRQWNRSCKVLMIMNYFSWYWIYYPAFSTSIGVSSNSYSLLIFCKPGLTTRLLSNVMEGRLLQILSQAPMNLKRYLILRLKVYKSTRLSGFCCTIISCGIFSFKINPSTLGIWKCRHSSWSWPELGNLKHFC